MRLDVILPTFNRSASLRLTLQSLLDARVPHDFHVGVTVVDNKSIDDTRATVESFLSSFAGRLTYIFEPRAGKSHALNAGIAATAGDLIGMIDDDEKIDAGWFEEIARAFSDPGLDYITGPYLPDWSVPPPAWMPMIPNAVVGWVDGGSQIRTIGVDYQGMMMGGNAVVRRNVLRATGGYDPTLGPTVHRRLFSCEDHEMQVRLTELRARGEYRPGLIIVHHVPEHRMTKSYHRRWYFWHGVSAGVMDQRRPQPVPYALGIPRYMVGRFARDFLMYIPGLIGVGPLRTSTSRLQAFLRSVEAVGFLYGRGVVSKEMRAIAPAVPARTDAASLGPSAN